MVTPVIGWSFIVDSVGGVSDHILDPAMVETEESSVMDGRSDSKEGSGEGARDGICCCGFVVVCCMRVCMVCGGDDSGDGDGDECNEYGSNVDFLKNAVIPPFMTGVMFPLIG